MSTDNINRMEFLARLDSLIEWVEQNRGTFRGSTHAHRALKRVRNLSVFR